MIVPSLLTGLVLLLLAPSAHALQSAPDTTIGDRLQGWVVTAAGDTLRGLIRWDRNEGGWADLLDGDRDLPPDLLDRAVEAGIVSHSELERSVEFRGVRVTWEEDDVWPEAARSGLRFGHVRRLEVLDGESARLELRSGETVELRSGGNTDLGDGNRGIVVEDLRRGRVTLEWDELDLVELEPVPGVQAGPDARRLHGTVTDEAGRSWEGYVTWDRDEILGVDVLDGEEEGGREVELPFASVTTITKLADGDGSRVRTSDGRTRELRGTNDVDDRNRGIQVADPALGQVSVPWEAFVSVRFHPPSQPVTLSDFGGGRPLEGRVLQVDGTEHRGILQWDADESATWEILDGETEGVTVQVEFGRIRAVRRTDDEGARVELLDGRTLELHGSNDVGPGHKGVYVETGDGEVVGIPWERIVEVDFGGSRGGSP
jgi:hypothetical protein